MTYKKVFGIGLSRTGTLSLCHALQDLGYRTIHWPKNVKEIDAYDAAVDSSVACRFEFLDAMYPGSKFIYTVRHIDTWMKSVERFFGRRNYGANREALKHWPPWIIASLEDEFTLYRTWAWDPDKFRAAYALHDAHVKRYFQGRESDLLRLNICDGEAWEPLCEFLEKTAPAKPFPHSNQSKP